MRLKQQLDLPQVRIMKVKITLGAEEHKVTLELQTALTRDVADAFGCRELIYAGSVPRTGVKEMTLEGSEVDCDVHLRHEGFAFSTVVEEMGHYVAKLEGDGPKLSFQVKFTGYVITVADLIEHVKIDPLEVILKPAQMPLELNDERKPEEDDDPEEDDSKRLISKEQAADTALADEDAPLASVVTMGGSHQRGNKKKHGTRKPDPDVIIDGDPEPEEDFLAEIGIPEVVQ